MKTRALYSILLSLISSVALAQAFPSKAVRIVTPYSSGTGPDLFTRALAEVLQKEWGQPAVVEAKPGGNGFIAIEWLKKAAPDGHELLVLGDAHLTINPSLFKNAPYDPIQDFVPISGLYRAYFFLAVASNGPYQNVPDLIAGAKANPGRLSYGTPYVGSPSHLGSAVFEHATGTKMIHVPFKDSLQIFTSIANGDVTWAIATAASTSAMVKAGRVKLIAVAAPNRLPTHPNVPTVEEAGGPKGFVVESWLALVAPRGTPPAVVRRINVDVQTALATPEMRKRLDNLGFAALPANAEEVGEKIRADLKKNAEIIRRVGATTD